MIIAASSSSFPLLPRRSEHKIQAKRRPRSVISDDILSYVCTQWERLHCIASSIDDKSPSSTERVVGSTLNQIKAGHTRKRETGYRACVFSATDNAVRFLSVGFVYCFDTPRTRSVKRLKIFWSSRFGANYYWWPSNQSSGLRVVPPVVIQ